MEARARQGEVNGMSRPGRALWKKVACEVNDGLRRGERAARSPDRTHLGLSELHELLADEWKISVQIITHIRCGNPCSLAAGIHRDLPHLPPPVRYAGFGKVKQCGSIEAHSEQ